MIHINHRAAVHGVPTAVLFQPKSKNPKAVAARQDLARALVKDLKLTLVQAGAVMGSNPQTISKLLAAGNIHDGQN